VIGKVTNKSRLKWRQKQRLDLDLEKNSSPLFPIHDHPSRLALPSHGLRRRKKERKEENPSKTSLFARKNRQAICNVSPHKTPCPLPKAVMNMDEKK
jgi:hypothetical protein